MFTSLLERVDVVVESYRASYREGDGREEW